MSNTQWRNVSKYPLCLLLGGETYRASPGSSVDIPSGFDDAINSRGLVGTCLELARAGAKVPELADAKPVPVDTDAKRKSKA